MQDAPLRMVAQDSPAIQGSPAEPATRSDIHRLFVGDARPLRLHIRGDTGLLVVRRLADELCKYDEVRVEAAHVGPTCRGELWVSKCAGVHRVQLQTRKYCSDTEHPDRTPSEVHVFVPPGLDLELSARGACHVVLAEKLEPRTFTLHMSGSAQCSVWQSNPDVVLVGPRCSFSAWRYPVRHQGEF